MPNTTPNLGLLKPTSNEYFDLEHQNTNMDLIDTNIKNLQDSQSASEILTKLKTVDGAGSGLDADTVKGYVPLNEESYNASDILAKLLTVDVNDSGLNATTVQGYSPVNKAGDIMSGGITTNKGSYGVSKFRDVLHYAASAATGTLKIKLPVTWNSTMLRITIKGYNYLDSTGSFELILGGYNYTDGLAWINTSATLVGKAPFSQVRFSHDVTTNCILLGDLTTAWQFTVITVDVEVGYNNTQAWASNWSASIIDTEAAIVTTKTHQVTPSLLGFSGPANVATNAWFSGGSGSSDYPAYTLVPVSGIKATDRVDVAFNVSYLLTAQTAEVVATSAYDGGFKMYAKSIPAGALLFDYTVTKGV